MRGATPAGTMFAPAFTAVCDHCSKTTMWFKANRVLAADDGQAPEVAKGFKCSSCDAFEEKVLDTRGRIQTRA